MRYYSATSTPTGSRAYQARRKPDGASARTLNKELQVLRQVLKRYKLWANLQGDVKFEREPTTSARPSTRRGGRHPLAACDSNVAPSTRLYLSPSTPHYARTRFGRYAGSQIDLLERTVTVGRAKTQGGSGSVIPLNQPSRMDSLAVGPVAWRAKPHDHIFPACEAAGIEREHPDRGERSTLPGPSSPGAQRGVRPSNVRVCRCAFTICGTPA